MNSLLVKIYNAIPKSLKVKIGQSKRLKGFRRQILYNSDGFKTAQVLINRAYDKCTVNFQFVASIKTAAKAKRVGIENTVLNHSFKLIEKYKPNRTDLTVLDVGANFGYLGLVWANSIAVNGKVMAFEPNKNLYTCINKTINANHSINNFEVYNLAVGAKNEKITLNASNFSSNTEAMETAIETYAIDMVTLDNFLNEKNSAEVDLIKIDVDGIELDILKGAENLLKKNNAIVIVETNNDSQIIEFFQKLDYTIYDMKLQVFNSAQELPLNIFCVPKPLESNAI